MRASAHRAENGRIIRTHHRHYEDEGLRVSEWEWVDDSLEWRWV